MYGVMEYIYVQVQCGCDFHRHCLACYYVPYFASDLLGSLSCSGIPCTSHQLYDRFALGNVVVSYYPRLLVRMLVDFSRQWTLFFSKVVYHGVFSVSYWMLE